MHNRDTEIRKSKGHSDLVKYNNYLLSNSNLYKKMNYSDFFTKYLQKFC